MPHAHGRLHLAAVEYVVIKAAWEASQPRYRIWDTQLW